MKILYLIVSAFLVTMPAQAADRFALVIGIDDYSGLADLRKARNDAAAVADSLERLGFSVSLLLDPERRSVTRGLSDVAAKVGPGDDVVFYFAGHGIQIDGRNYLIPADAPAAGPGDEAFLTAESVAVDRVLETLQSQGARTTVLILDACRDNPFPRKGTRAVGSGRGLAPVVATEGSFILYSAGSGQTALDRLADTDDDPNSVFTRNLLPFLTRPDQPLQEMVRNLRAEVEAQAATIGHRQRPAYYDELTGDYLLAAAPPPEPVPPAPPAAEDPCSEAERDWQGVSALNDPALLRAFAVAHFSCETLRGAALDRVGELEGKAAFPAADPAVPQAVPVPGLPAALASPPEPAATVPAVPGPLAPPSVPAAFPSEDTVAARHALVEAAQTELRRLGCYRGKIDGDWGPGSRKALASFYRVTRHPDLGAEPTEALLAALKAPGNQACPKPAPAAARASPARTAKPAPAPQPAAPAAAAPAAAPVKKKKNCGKLILLPFPRPIDLC